MSSHHPAMLLLEPCHSRREPSPSVAIPWTLFTQSYHFTLPLARCCLCASVSCRHYLRLPQSMSATASCLLTAVENVEQHPSTQEIMLHSRILSKDFPYRVKDYQLPSCSCLAKKLVHYKAQRRGNTLISYLCLAPHVSCPLWCGIFHSLFFFPVLRKNIYLIQRQESGKLSPLPRKS